LQEIPMQDNIDMTKQYGRQN